MAIMLLTAVIIALTLGALTYFAEGRRAPDADETQSAGKQSVDKQPVYSLLPGDIKYESPSGNFRFYFPVTTSIILSVVLTVLLRLFS